MDTKHFAIQEFVEEDLVVLEYIKSQHNSADTLTKPLARTAFYKHNDVIMGRIPPKYYKGKLTPTHVSTEDSYMLPAEHGGVMKLYQIQSNFFHIRCPCLNVPRQTFSKKQLWT